MHDREKVIKELTCCIYSEEECECPKDCPYNDGDMGECQAQVMRDALALLKEQEEKIRQLESMNVSASGNGTAIGVVKGGLVIQKGQNNKHIVNNGTMTMTFGK